METTTATRYYVLRREDLNRPGEPVTIIIQTEPGTTNMSHEPRTDGWLGTTNNVHWSAWGEYATEDEARTYIAETFGVVSEYGPEYEDEIARYVVHRLVEGAIVDYDLDDEDFYEQFGHVDAEWLLTLDVGNFEVCEELQEILRSEGFEDVDVLSITSLGAERLERILRQHYSVVQIIEENVAGGVFYILARA